MHSAQETWKDSLHIEGNMLRSNTQTRFHLHHIAEVITVVSSFIKL